MSAGLNTIFENQVIKGMRGEGTSEFGEAYIIQEFQERTIYKIISIREGILNIYLKAMKRLANTKFLIDTQTFGNFFNEGEKIDYFEVNFVNVIDEVRKVSLLEFKDGDHQLDTKAECLVYEADYIGGERLGDIIFGKNTEYNFKDFFLKLGDKIEEELKKDIDGEIIHSYLKTRSYFSTDQISQIGDMNIKLGTIYINEKGEKILKLVITDIAISIREVAIRILNREKGIDLNTFSC